MKILVNDIWCDTKEDWGYESDQDFAFKMYLERRKYEHHIKKLIEFCENPDNRHRLSDSAMCKFLDDLRTSLFKILAEEI